MKTYTTGQAIRILERYPDRGYLFQAPRTEKFNLSRLSVHRCQLACEEKALSTWEYGSPYFRSDWCLFRPERKHRRHVVVGKVEDRCIKIDADGQCVLLSGDWTLIAVERRKG